MPLNSRAKGLRGENEAIRMLQPLVNEVCGACGKVPFELIRDQRQRYEEKHYDVFGIPWMALEVKRVEELSGLEGWWRQVKAAAREGQIPVLMYRQNHGRWRVRMKATVTVGKGGPRVRMTVNIAWEDFCYWFREKLKYELGSEETRRTGR